MVVERVRVSFLVVLCLVGSYRRSIRWLVWCVGWLVLVGCCRFFCLSMCPSVWSVSPDFCFCKIIEQMVVLFKFPFPKKIYMYIFHPSASFQIEARLQYLDQPDTHG